MSEVDGTVTAKAGEDIVDEVIAAAGGDPREAIRALIRGQDAIRAEAHRQVSRGYARGRLQ